MVASSSIERLSDPLFRDYLCSEYGLCVCCGHVRVPIWKHAGGCVIARFLSSCEVILQHQAYTGASNPKDCDNALLIIRTVRPPEVEHHREMEELKPLHYWPDIYNAKPACVNLISLEIIKQNIRLIRIILRVRHMFYCNGGGGDIRAPYLKLPSLDGLPVISAASMAVNFKVTACIV
jgi:hypothetical protein